MADEKSPKTTAKTASQKAATAKERSPQAKKASVKATGATSADRRAALREQQLKQQQAARQRKQLKVGALLLAILLALGLGIWGLVTLFNKPKDELKPQHLSSDGYAITVYGDKAKQGVKTVAIYSDYQCPACKSFETQWGSALADMAKAGDIRLEMRTLTFLDQNLPGSNKSSFRAAVAASCVDATSDKYLDYFTTVYANQPAKEGVGYTDEQLKTTFAQQAGLSGDSLKKFQECYDKQATKAFVSAADTSGEKTLTQLSPQGFGTPSVTVNGKLMDLSSLKQGDPNSLKAAIDATK